MKILGLDIGSSSIKAVQLDSTFGRIELADYAIEPVIEPKQEENESTSNAEQSKAEEKRELLTDSQSEAIKRLLAEKQFKFDRLVVGFPKQFVTTRVFHFPTRDRKTIQSSLQFELDDDIPFGMDEIVYDFSVVNSEGTSSTIFTAMVLKKDLVSYVSSLQLLGLDPDLITTETWGLSYILKRSIPSEYQGRPVCLIHIGDQSSSIQMFIEENPVLSHVSTCAGAAISKTISDSYHLPLETAEQSKIESAFLLTETHLKTQGDQITDDQKLFSATIARALTPLIHDIKQTLMAFKSSNKLAPKAVFISGGSSLIPNLPLYLEEQIKLPVFNLSYVSQIVGQTLSLSEMTEANIASAMGLALSGVKVERNLTLNFRKDEFSKRGGFGAFDWKSYKTPLQFMAASLVFVYLNLVAQGIILNTRNAAQQERLERTIKSVLGAVTPSTMRTYILSPSTLKRTVEREVSKYKVPEAPKVEPEVSAFDVLNEVSKVMPKDITLDSNLFEIKDGSFKLSGLVDKPLSADRIAKALEEVRLLKDVSKEKVEENIKEKNTSFEITAKVASKESEVKNGKTR